MGNPVTPKVVDRTTHESFLIRVYRRSDEPGREVAGLIEPVASGKPLAFTGRDELWAALAQAPSGQRGRSARKSRE